MVEVLVVMIVTAIGLLGVAALQAGTMRSSKNAHLASAANLAIGDIAERMRANSGGHGADLPYRVLSSYTAVGGTKPTAGTCVSNCTSQQVAAEDLVRWQRWIAEALPGGGGFVTGTPQDGYQVTIAWREVDVNTQFGSVNANCPAAIAAPADVRCVVAVVRP